VNVFIVFSYGDREVPPPKLCSLGFPERKMQSMFNTFGVIMILWKNIAG
jgi:hypothetical protein